MLNIHDRIVFTHTFDNGPEIDKKYTYSGSGKFSGQKWTLRDVMSHGSKYEVVFDSVYYCKMICEYVDLNPNILNVLYEMTNDNSFYEISMDWWQNTIIGSSVSLWNLVKTTITMNHDLRGDLLNFEIPRDALQTSRGLERSRYSI